MRWFSASLMLLSLISATAFVGCEKPAEKKPVAKDDHSDHDHHHHGTHGGHLAEVGEEEYHLEWTHEPETGKVTIYVLDGAGTKDVAATGEELIVVVKMDKESEHKLAAVNPKDGKANQFETTDKEFEGAISLLGKKGVTATIKKLEIGEKTFENVKLEEHEHH